MKIKILLLIGLLLSSLSSCAQMNSLGVIENNKAHNADQLDLYQHNHDVLVNHHEEIAKELQKKLEEQKRLLKDYEDHSYYYGRSVQDLIAHAEANIRYYERLLQTNSNDAALHREILKEKGAPNYTGIIKHNPDSLEKNDLKPVKVVEDLSISNQESEQAVLSTENEDDG